MRSLIFLAVAQPRILYGRGQSITTSVTDVFLTVKNWQKSSVKILDSLVREGRGHFDLILAAPLILQF